MHGLIRILRSPHHNIIGEQGFILIQDKPLQQLHGGFYIRIAPFLSRLAAFHIQQHIWLIRSGMLLIRFLLYEPLFYRIIKCAVIILQTRIQIQMHEMIHVIESPGNAEADLLPELFIVAQHCLQCQRHRVFRICDTDQVKTVPIHLGKGCVANCRRAEGNDLQSVRGKAEINEPLPYDGGYRTAQAVPGQQQARFFFFTVLFQKLIGTESQKHTQSQVSVAVKPFVHPGRPGKASLFRCSPNRVPFFASTEEGTGYLFRLFQRFAAIDHLARDKVRCPILFIRAAAEGNHI